MTPFSRTTILALRLSTFVICVPSLTLFVIILKHVLDNTDIADRTGLTALPVVALSITITWNIMACLIILLTKPTPATATRIITLTLDLLAAVVLTVLGGFGFAHDDTTYLDNGWWSQGFTAFDDWFGLDVGAFSMLGVAVLLQLLVAVIAFWGNGKASRVERGLHPGDLALNPPMYAEKEIHEQFEEDWRSVASSEGSMKKNGKGNFVQV